MTEVVLFADATATVIDLLADAFTERDVDSPVLPRVPTDRPEAFVVVQRTGGVSASIVVDRAQITVDCWGSSDEEAHDLAQLCRGLLHAATGTVQDDVVLYDISELAGPGNLPDLQSNQPRYRQSFLVATRGTVEPTGS